jgi:hypothetical protein
LIGESRRECASHQPPGFIRLLLSVCLVQTDASSFPSGTNSDVPFARLMKPHLASRLRSRRIPERSKGPELHRDSSPTLRCGYSSTGTGTRRSKQRSLTGADCRELAYFTNPITDELNTNDSSYGCSIEMAAIRSLKRFRIGRNVIHLLWNMEAIYVVSLLLFLFVRVDSHCSPQLQSLQRSTFEHQ